MAAVVIAGIAARAWRLFSTPLVPGMNGAYYPIQARALLEKGALGIPDLPLTFALQAGLAKGRQRVTDPVLTWLGDRRPRRSGRASWRWSEQW